VKEILHTTGRRHPTRITELLERPVAVRALDGGHREHSCRRKIETDRAGSGGALRTCEPGSRMNHL